MDAQGSTGRTRAAWAIGAAAVAVAAVIGILVLSDDDDTVGTSDTSAPTTTSTAPTSTLPGDDVDRSVAVFPDPATSRRFDEPAALAHAFAVDLLGFRAPIVGDFAAGDSRSGEVELRAVEEGTPTTVFVRQLADDTWFVVGAQSSSIRLDTPGQGATITSPQPVTGAAYAFEGTVDVRLFADGRTEPVARTFVTGRGDGVLGDFAGELDFTAPVGASHGVLVLSEASAEDGSTLAATVIRVRLG